ncbi:MAG: TonB-dependent receptor [Cyclobacteriaceae bacterium]
MSKRLAFLVLLFLAGVFSFSQNCTLEIKGKLIDEATGEELPAAVIYLEEQKKAVFSDTEGDFVLQNVCACENCHLRITHLGCEPKTILLSLKSDTVLSLKMHHHTELLNEVVIHGDEESTEVSSSIEKNVLIQEGNKNVADALSSIEGVSTLKNGSGIAKPIIHGLFGNRIAIMNNGVPHSGQRWGNDHAPEIDLFVADHLSVIKGASSLEYAGSSLGGVILVDVNPVSKDPHVHGQANYIFQTNGRGHTGNIQLENANKLVNWRVTATAKRIGDQKSPTYFLTNTGRKENDVAIQLQKDISKNWLAEVYYSYVNAELGVLRGALISTQSDLEASFDREEPFGTQNDFSREINSPRQLVNHHLLKIKNTYYFNDSTSLQFTYGGQWNNRKEFDVRRSGRSDIPAVFMQQSQQFGELTLSKKLRNKAEFKTGLQLTSITNINDNGITGRLPLIPNYRSYNPAAFFIFHKQEKKLFWEAGARYSFVYRDVADITPTAPRTVQRFTNEFHNLGFNTGVKYKWNKKLETKFSVGVAYRSPEVNELYSFGVHQAVASFERGNINLKPEKSVKAVLSNRLLLHEELHIQLLTYAQRVNDFIYLQPSLEDTTTIRGAFRFFDYEQANVAIYGLDAKVTYEPTEQLKLVTKYAIVRGENLSRDESLINMPADNVSMNLLYLLKNKKKIQNTQFAINGKYVAKQKRISIADGQDFFETPDAYFILGASAKTSIQLQSSVLVCSLSIENALNTTYRDYLNRLRYFSNEVGTNVNLGVSYQF